MKKHLSEKYLWRVEWLQQGAILYLISYVGIKKNTHLIEKKRISDCYDGVKQGAVLYLIFSAVVNKEEKYFNEKQKLYIL